MYVIYRSEKRPLELTQTQNWGGGAGTSWVYWLGYEMEDTGFECRYCIAVESRRLMLPDALQPKAYCTNPSL